MKNRNIISIFLQAVAANPEKAALRQDSQFVSYADLLAEIQTAAAFYRKKGIRKGDRVLVFVPMSLSLYRAVLALFYLGACPVFLDEWISISRLKACLETVPCSGVIASRKFLFLSFFIAPLRRLKMRTGARRKAVKTSDFVAAEVAEEDTALITFTTGSTGIPKAANRTHDYLHAQLQALKPLLLAAGSPCMTTLPIVVLLHLAMGKTALLPPGKFKASSPATARHLLHALAVSKPRGLIASPAILSMITRQRGLNLPGMERWLGQIKTVLTGGGPVYPALAAAMLSAFPNADITAVYGSTEAEPIAHIDGGTLAGVDLETILTRGLPVGRIDAAAQVAIIDPTAESRDIRDEASFTSALLPFDTAGEVLVAGGHVLQHYINNAEAEADTKLRIAGKVWHRTGDCGVHDGAGNLYLLGRCSEVFRWKNRPYYPATFCYAFQILTGVETCALIFKKGLPLLILERADTGLAEKARAVLEQLALPEAQIRFVADIPKDPRHQTKIDYTALRGLLE